MRYGNFGKAVVEVGALVEIVQVVGVGAFVEIAGTGRKVSGRPGMSETVRRFEDLEAWQIARELANVIYSLARAQPMASDFG